MALSRIAVNRLAVMLTPGVAGSWNISVMPIVAVLLFILATATPIAAATGGEPSPEQLFQQFGLFGTWASNCQAPASPANPHVEITEPSPGVILEDHHLGEDYIVNRYSVLSAEKLSDTRLSVEVLFHPGADDQERQKLTFAIRDQTRRTVFNQVEGGAVRVKDGVVLPQGINTPLLHKCK
jgi:hypothetical protein